MDYIDLKLEINCFFKLFLLMKKAKFVINFHCSKLKVIENIIDNKVNKWQEFV